MISLIPALTCNGLLAIAAYYKKALTLDGALTATAVGTCIWLLGGLQGFLIMGIFFVAASLLSKFKRTQRAALHLEARHDKSDRRDFTQVLANSLVPLGFLFAYALSHESPWYIGFLSAFAASSADTWASEIGVLSRTPPKTILGHKALPVGMSGGVTNLGLFASCLGAGLIAGSAFVINLSAQWLSALSWLSPFSTEPSKALINTLVLSLIIGAAGFFGAILDSLMGETLQAKYKAKDPSVIMTERAESNELISGYRWIDNNVVNFASVAVAALAASAIAFMLAL